MCKGSNDSHGYLFSKLNEHTTRRKFFSNTSNLLSLLVLLKFKNKILKNDSWTKSHSSYLFPKKWMRQLKVFSWLLRLDVCNMSTFNLFIFQCYTNSADRKLYVFLSIIWNLTVFRLSRIPPHNLAYGIGKLVMHNSIYDFQMLKLYI